MMREPYVDTLAKDMRARITSSSQRAADRPHDQRIGRRRPAQAMTSFGIPASLPSIAPNIRSRLHPFHNRLRIGTSSATERQPGRGIVREAADLRRQRGAVLRERRRHIATRQPPVRFPPRRSQSPTAARQHPRQFGWQHKIRRPKALGQQMNISRAKQFSQPLERLQRKQRTFARPAVASSSSGFITPSPQMTNTISLRAARSLATAVSPSALFAAQCSRKHHHNRVGCNVQCATVRPGRRGRFDVRYIHPIRKVANPLLRHSFRRSRSTIRPEMDETLSNRCMIQRSIRRITRCKRLLLSSPMPNATSTSKS